ncbi:MAG: hypothetical protein VX083_13050 [Pseudomonadota bacterium]|nr:hypothetical protein [Pseudomonadota bacterium]
MTEQSPPTQTREAIEEPPADERPAPAPEPSSDTPHRFLGLDAWRWGVLSSFVSVLGIFGVLFGIYQYTMQLEAQRADRTLEMIEQWRDDGYRASFVALSDEVATLLASVPAADLAAAKATPRAAANLRSKVLRRVLGKAENQQRLDTVVFYFNKLGLCVEARLCSTKTTEIFFGSTVEGFVDVFGPEIAARRTEEPDYANGFRFLPRQ